MSLEPWGWDEAWAERAAREGIGPSSAARVTGQDRAQWSVQTDSGPGLARITSRRGVNLPPATGDWVGVEPGPLPADPWSITRVLPRRTVISRGAAGTGGGAQVLAANVDRVWIVHGLDRPPNLRRFERYLAVVWNGGATPEIVLSKADLADDLEAVVGAVESSAVGAPVRCVSSEDPASIRSLRESLVAGCTITLLGPSGVGKSTLVNLLADEAIAGTGEVRKTDRKGRHTTVRRELFRLPGGALLLDTPGMRELRIGAVDEGLREAFSDIEEIARGCRFRDCRHDGEPGCAVQEAVEQGRLNADRLGSLRKLQAEAAHEARKVDPLARAAALSDWKTATKTMKQHPKYRDR